MSKSKSFVKYLKKINTSTNNLLEKNLNKLKLTNILNLVRSNKIFLSIVAVLILLLSYLSIPNFYKQNNIILKLKNELNNKFNLNLKFSDELRYNLFPTPHFTSNDTILIFQEEKISEIKKIKIYFSLENLFSFKNLKIKEVEIEKANFELNKSNYDFFIKLLDNNYQNCFFTINDSNIFYRNIQNEVLFINKILKMKYSFDSNESKNILDSENEIFNLPFSLKVHNDKTNKNFFSKINISLLRLQAENNLSYKDDLKFGNIDIISQNLNSTLEYEFNKKYFEFNYFDRLANQKFLYNGKLNFSPFYSSLEGSSDELDLSHLFDKSAIISQLLKAEIFNNKNINLNLKIKAGKILNFNNFTNILINSKIHEGLIDIDGTAFKWKNYVNFKLFNSLIYIKNGELYLDGTSSINIINNNEVFKFLLTPKNHRKKIKQIDLNYSYNFDQKTISLNDIRVDGKYNERVNKKLNNISIKNDDLQNKIYFKKLLNDALKTYSG